MTSAYKRLVVTAIAVLVFALASSAAAQDIGDDRRHRER